MGCADPDFTLCWPPEVRSRPTAAGSARTPSRRRRSQSPFVATAWPRTPGSCVVPCGRTESHRSAASAARRKILWAFGWRPALRESEVADAPTLEPMMLNDAPRPAQAAIRTDLGAIFVSMELSRRTWLITSLSPGSGEKMSKHSVPASDVAGLLHRFAELKRKATARGGRDFPIIVIQEAGLDGFWIHRVLQSEGTESPVVAPASILTSRRARRAKTDRIDGETLVRTLMAFKRGEPRVCSMARAPTPQEEDRRRDCRERRPLVGERVRHVNRIQALVFAQRIF